MTRKQQIENLQSVFGGASDTLYSLRSKALYSSSMDWLDIQEQNEVGLMLSKMELLQRELALYAYKLETLDKGRTRADVCGL